MLGKLLMFVKLSLKTFIYSLVETLYFPIQFIIISDPGNDYEESKISDIILEVIVKTDIYKRFDTSHPFWENFNARKPKRQKKD